MPSTAQSPAHTHPRYVSRQPAWSQWPTISGPFYIVLGLTLAPALCRDVVMVTGVFIDGAVLLTSPPFMTVMTQMLGGLNDKGDQSAPVFSFQNISRFILDF